MNGITEIRMRKIQSRTRQYRRRYEWREISWLTVCSLFLLAGIGILLGHIQEPGISSVAEDYGAVLLRNGADLYVTIGIFYSRCGDDDHLYPLEEEKMAAHRIRKKVRKEYEKAIE